MKYYPRKYNNNNSLGFGLFDDDFADFFKPFYGFDREANAMRTDIQEKDGNYLLEVDLPGYDKKDINVSLENGYLTVSAVQNKNVEEKNDKNYIRRERVYGSCSRSFYVGNVEQKDVKAKYENGILNISFPKENKQLPDSRNIEIL